MNHRLFSTAAGLAALVATFAGTSFYASSSESLVARLPIISAQGDASPSAPANGTSAPVDKPGASEGEKVGWPVEPQLSSKNRVAAPHGQTESKAVRVGEFAPQATLPVQQAQMQARLPQQQEARSAVQQASATEAVAQPNVTPSASNQSPAAQPAVTQPAATQVAVTQAVQPAIETSERSEQASDSPNPNVELTAYTHLRALNESQYESSVRTGRIEQDYATHADHSDIRPVYVADDEEQSADDVDAPEQLPPGVYTGNSYEGACGPSCNAHDHGGWLWTFGVEETFLVPDRDGTLASVTVSSPFETFSAASKESMEFGPRLWFGIQKPHWQVLARLWLLNSVDNEYDPVLLGTGDRRGTMVDSDVQAFTVDVEAQRLFIGADGWNHYVGFGYRYASLEDVARVSATALDTTNPIPAVIQADAFAFSKIDGSGVTVSFGATKPLHIGCCSQLDFFYNMRGSMVWGKVESATQTSVVVLDPNIPSSSNRFDAAAADGRDELFIGEFQVGARWTHELKCMPGIAFFQAAFEYQWWDADGGIAFSESAALLNANQGLATAISGPNTEINLIGFALGAGVVW